MSREEQTRVRGDEEQHPSLTDLLIPAVPGLITSLVLEAVQALSGPGKLAVGMGLGVLLWVVVRRRRPSRGRDAERDGPPRAALRRWRWALVSLAAVAVLAIAVTAALYARPSPLTIATAVTALVVLTGLALAGRRGPGAAAAALSGAVVGLCVAIAALLPA